MFGVFKNFLNSEKAVASGMLVIAVSVFLAIGKITYEQWLEASQWFLGIYVGGKSLQGAAAAATGAKAMKSENAELKAKLADNDAAADAALAAKEGDEDGDGEDDDNEETNPGDK